MTVAIRRVTLADCMVVTRTFSAAAFAPFGQPGSEPLKKAAGRAISWIKQREIAEGRQASVMLPQRRDYDALSGFDKNRPTGTPRSHKNLTAGPVLVYAASLEMIDLATPAAAGSSIAVVDWNLEWLPGWAAAVEATNLQTGEEAAPFVEETAELLEHLHWAGNNGWHDQPGKRDAKRLLAELNLPVTTVQGAMLGYGHSARSIRDLAKLIPSR